MHRYNAGDIAQVLNTEDSRNFHNLISTVYPKPYTMGIVQDTDDTHSVHLYLKYLGLDSPDESNMWWHLGRCVRYISHKELRTMIRYYELYQKSTYFSVRDFYDKVSAAKKVAEDAIKDKMQIYEGAEYRVLCGNNQSFTAAFTIFNMLYVVTPTREYIIDMPFMQKYLENGKE